MRIKELDGVRGIAVLVVINHHYMSWLPATGAWYGWLGVDLFFVLSGFLITSILLDLRESEHYFKIFYSRRALRIFPPYFLGILVYLAASFALGKPGTVELWLQYIFYYSSLLIHFPMTHLSRDSVAMPVAVSFGLGIMWSLSVEEIYYTIWAPVVRFTTEKHLSAILITIVTMAPFLRWRLITEHVGILNFYCRMDGLAFGSALALLILHRRLSPETWLRTDRWFDGLALIAGPLSVCYWLAAKPHVLGPVAGVTLADMSFALTIYALIRRAGGDQFWVRVFRAKWLRSVGMVSYSLYLFHYALLIVSGDLIAQLHLSRRVNAVSVTLFALLMTFAVAYGLWYGMESRILRWKDRKVPSPAHAHADVVAANA
jgi:peptidoglycan/LPS O-acetylase OafA/YrhL